MRCKGLVFGECPLCVSYSHWLMFLCLSKQALSYKQWNWGQWENPSVFHNIYDTIHSGTKDCPTNTTQWHQLQLYPRVPPDPPTSAPGKGTSYLIALALPTPCSPTLILFVSLLRIYLHLIILGCNCWSTCLPSSLTWLWDPQKHGLCLNTLKK